MAKTRRRTKQRQAARRKRRGAARPDRARILIVEARYYDHIADALLKGAVRALRAAKVSYSVITVPGALEIPVAVAIAVDAAERKARPFDGAVALGCVIRGETFHFEVVATQSARALMDFAVVKGLPVGNGILTVESEMQALARARLEDGDKGGEAARAALALVRLKRSQVGS